MSKELDNFLAAYSREAREITLSLRRIVVNVFHNAEEQVNTKTGMITYSFSKKISGSWVCAIAPHMKHVNLIFSNGSQISDPAKLLVGTGVQTRHVKLKSEVETEDPELILLLKEAIKLGRV